MKKSILIGFLIFLLIGSIILIRMIVSYKTEFDRQESKVYSFSGKDTNIRISNGIIIIFPNKQIVNGGDIQFIGNNQEKIKSYSKTIYLDKKVNKDIILSNTVSYQGCADGAMFADEFLSNKSAGEISSDKLFTKSDINNIKDNLYFSLEYSTVDGKTEHFTIKLNVKEFAMD
ncbi:hypothetical protein CDLVIII_3016 [Clostridium sp. DL-VIII]|uniref:hypothetical protein n=1 Tax=Clostridium sp. DL-VIII TaxID=641107 RepID=UPI00023AFD79|nr:hypothetical protein [Clostridium sp. DL-VIII]EHI99606.1 hypothetical protein CDLVIII_3016 [Clostridium sp. DL-VIII]